MRHHEGWLPVLRCPDRVSSLRLLLAGLVALLAVGLPGMPARAGQLSQDEVAMRLPPPLRVGARLADIPAWPVVDPRADVAGPVGYVFESIDLAPIPGFAGHPVNLLVSIDAAGVFLDVQVLSQHEPMFLDALGVEPLNAFVRRYRGHNLRQQFSIAPAHSNAASLGDDRHVVLDGISTATVSARIVNQTVLTAALAIARARMGGAVADDHAAPAVVRQDVFRSRNFAQLLADGDIVHRKWTNHEVEALFSRGGAGLDPDAIADPGREFVDLYVAQVNVPTIGRSLLGDVAYQALMRDAAPGRQFYWVATAGRHSLKEPGFTPRSAPARLTVSQDGIPVELRDVDLVLRGPEGAPQFNAMLVLQSPPQSGVDPGRALQFSLDVTRERALVPGLTMPGAPGIPFRQALMLDYEVSARYLDRPSPPPPEWLQSWKSLLPELATIVVALALLSAVLSRPRWMTVHPRRQKVFRLGFLAFTLGFIGWYAQGQLSVVQITGAINALASGRGLGSFLYDPVSLLLIAFTVLSFFIWGRGTFCGWLCPFGALQEFSAVFARVIGLKQRRLPQRVARGLAQGRHVVLAGLVLAAVAAPPALLDAALEVEPFKTSISMMFSRSWPFLLYAVSLLLLGGVYYKFFCRFLCPLGAAMTLGGRLRRLDWLRRREGCGQPCQTCRHRCDYDAIERNGAIRYDHCFQCLDCVGIYHDPGRCAPLLLHARKGRTIRIATAPSGKRQAAEAEVFVGRIGSDFTP